MYIRLAQKNDLPAIIDIYNQAVGKGFMTADTECWTMADKEVWFRDHVKDLPIYIAENEREIIGWLAVSPYRPGRNALRFTREISYYIDEKFWGMGVGSNLLHHALLYAKELKVKNYIAIVLDANLQSIRLLEKMGFSKWGHLPGVADFEGKICGHLYYGLAI